MADAPSMAELLGEDIHEATGAPVNPVVIR
jgi:hypothetical protein